jgi:hypothetical protein
MLPVSGMPTVFCFFFLGKRILSGEFPRAYLVGVRCSADSRDRLVELSIESPALVITSVSEYFSVQHFDSAVPRLRFLSWCSTIRGGSFALGGGRGGFPFPVPFNCGVRFFCWVHPFFT